MKYTDAKAVLQLAQGILKDTKAIFSTVAELELEFKTLQGSFLDDGIELVNNYVTSISAKTNSASESAREVSIQLVNYADLLIKGK